MRFYISFILVFISISCSSQKAVLLDCNENLLFKEKFFQSIEDVEVYTVDFGDREKFDLALGFLKKHVYVSTDKMLNYNNAYESVEAFQIDKENWLKWYNEMKCNNLTFEKDNVPN
jgi:hypothetical protein|tara:strand:+ start:2600 stop:2947 length:348 start_codon:yes stop_codon:yes gene_type:complete